MKISSVAVRFFFAFDGQQVLASLISAVRDETSYLQNRNGEFSETVGSDTEEKEFWFRFLQNDLGGSVGRNVPIISPDAWAKESKGAKEVPTALKLPKSQETQQIPNPPKNKETQKSPKRPKGPKVPKVPKKTAHATATVVVPATTTTTVLETTTMIVPAAIATTVPATTATTVPAMTATTVAATTATTGPATAAMTVSATIATTIPATIATTVPATAAMTFHATTTTAVPATPTTTVPATTKTTVPVTTTTTVPIITTTTVPVTTTTTVPATTTTTVPSSPCGLTPCDVGVLQCDSGKCEIYENTEVCVSPNSTPVSDSCNTDCDCLGRHMGDYGEYITCYYSHVYRYYHEECLKNQVTGQCAYSGYKPVAPYSGVGYDDACNAEKCVTAIMNICSDVVATFSYNSYCYNYCYSS